MFAQKSISRMFSVLFVIVFMLAVAPLQSAQAAGVRYAKPAASGAGDCSSWANACTLQTALTGAVSGDEIWVAAGTHKPTSTPTNRDATFQLKSGAALYGGFAGTETARDQRNPAVNVTILSGDIDNNDSQTPIITDATTVTGNTTNSYHVVTSATGATLDGLTITAGYAHGTPPNDSSAGAGMFNSSSSLTLMNVTFSGNWAYYGAGMFNSSSSPTLANVTFSGNWALNGGGMYNTFGSHPTLTNVSLSRNSATYGSGMYNDSSSPALTNVTFSGNLAWGSGSGMYNTSGSSPTLTNVTFSGNSGQINGGSGGGMYNTSGSSPTIRNTILWGNTAPTGAQIYNYDTASSPIVSDSVVRGGCPARSACTNTITADPQLGTLGDYGGSTETISLLPGSSAIDAGNDAVCPATDQRGLGRPQGAHCDIGALEYDYTVIYYVYHVKPVASGTGNCQSWANACTLQTALTGAVSGDEIWAAAGTYKPTTGTDRTATFQLKSGVALYGGFAGTETARDRRNPATNVTILSGDIDNNDSQTPLITDLTTVTGNTTNSYHVVTGAASATLDGFTITAGYANGTSPYDSGAGMFNSSSSPTLANVTFSGNWALNGGGMYNTSGSNPTLTNVIFSGNSAYSAPGYGGGMYNTTSSPTLTNVTFSGNSARSGGGMFSNTSSPTLMNVTFSGNSVWSSGSGGGMYNMSGSPTLMNVTFSGNSAYWAGGMYNFGGNSSHPTLTNVTFSGNSAYSGGGMFNFQYASPTLTNVTFSGNSATGDYGGGMYNQLSSNPQIYNTIFWGNTAFFGAQIFNDGSSSVVSDSVVPECPVGSTCPNIITTDPVLGTLGNYGGSTQTIPLLPGSSAIDTGNDAICPATDQRGAARPQGAHCDIGAFEYYVLDTTPPIVNSITRLNPSPTILASVGFTVTFSESVTGVGVSDFSLTTAGISGASVTGVSGSGSVYTVTVNTGSGTGTLRLDVTDDDSIVDMAGNPLGGTGAGNGSFTGGETYDVRFHQIHLPLVLRNQP